MKATPRHFRTCSKCGESYRTRFKRAQYCLNCVSLPFRKKYFTKLFREYPNIELTQEEMRYYNTIINKDSLTPGYAKYKEGVTND